MLLIYIPGKKGLKFDIVFIITLQLASMGYGMYVMYINRPAIVAYHGGSYYVVPMIRFDSRGIDVSTNRFFQGKLPAFVNIRLPPDSADRLNVKIERIWTGLETAIDLYEPYENALVQLSKEGLSVDEARTRGIAIPADIAGEKIRIFNLVTRYNIYAIAVNPDTGQPVMVLGIVQTWDNLKNQVYQR